MNTFLFVWNPKKHNWPTLKQDIKQLESSGRFVLQWSCFSHKKVIPGDRAFLTKVGTFPKGIFASGYVASMPFLTDHWGDKKTKIYRVLFDFEVLLNPMEDPILTIERLQQAGLNSQNWTPEPSGVPVKPEIVDKLEAIWFDFLKKEKIRQNPFVNKGSEKDQKYEEGTPGQVVLTKYERNPYARQKCIEKYGFSCMVCGFNFEKQYGQVGKDYIHVHHLTQISSIGKTHEIDPIKDLRPVCPNCHAIIHRQKDSFSIEAVKGLIKQHK